jgi:hypothetical protein
MGRFPLQPTADEIAFGFAVAESPAGVRALTMSLTKDLCAVKVISDDGAVEYVVCNDHFEPLYTAAKSLDELRRRFVRSP